jgi:putative ABC transport system substrate-binding protein
MRRRQFIAGLTGIAAWSAAAYAQQSDRIRRVAILMGSADNAEQRPRLALFTQALAQLGWVDGQNIKIDVRWNDNAPQRMAAQARDLVQSNPDVILASPSRVVIPLQRETRTIPIVFVTVTDPVGQARIAWMADKLGFPIKGGARGGFR